MNTQRSLPHRDSSSALSSLAARRSRLRPASVAACTRVETSAAAPPLPQVTAAAAIARDVTEWDEFTGRLEAGAVGRRPAARLGPHLDRVVRGRQPRPAGTAALPDRRPSVPGAGRPAARRARAGDGRARPRRDRNAARRSPVEPRTRCRSRSASGAPAPRPRRPRTSMPSRPRCAPPSSISSSRTVVSPIDGRVSRALVTRGNLVSGGQGEATLLTTVVSVDPIYASFDADEQTFLRYGDRARQQGRAAAQAPADRDGARRRADVSARGHAAVSRQPARSVDRHDQRPRDLPQPRSPPDARAVRPPAPAGNRRVPGRARRGSRRRHRSRSPLRAGRRRRQEDRVAHRHARPARRRPARRAQRA